MNKLTVTGIVVGALVFGGGAGAMITNTVAEHNLEQAEFKHKNDLETVEVKYGEQIQYCHSALRMSDQSIGDLSNYFEASNAYVANLPHPGFQLDQNLAEQTRNLREVYLETDWGQTVQSLKGSCGYAQ